MYNSSDNDFKNRLKQFDMISEGGANAPGLLFANEKTDNPSEIIALEYAKKYQANAVYFRRFQDDRPPIPQIYIYDFTKAQPNEDEFAQLCKKLWNSGQVPLFFVFCQTEVKIFNCLNALQFEKDTGRISLSVFETIRLAAKTKVEIEKLKDFSAKNFDNGAFWNIPKYQNRFSQKKSAYFTLLNELRRTRASVVKQETLPKEMAQKLLVMSILLKYLEEREDENGSKVFPPGFFRSFSDGDDFVSVLRKKGACLDLFDFLSSPDCFNGDIFNWSNADERKKLKNADLNAFADFFEGRLDNGQYTFWRLYSFNDLPIELISNIYEEFLESKKGVVYTPPYLVNFLMDEIMPLTDFHKTDFKVIDPACGSGIFLVAAFRRMLHWWRIRNDWKKPGAENLDELKQILKNNIFGVDIHEEAVRLTFFSLSLALLDELSPKVIWENLKFDNLLENNLIGKDFFELIRDGYFEPDFDAVIGNPPFIRELTKAAKTIESKSIEKNERPKLPNNHLALLFLEQSMKLCKPDSWTCLIMPAGPFLYNKKSKGFRSYLLNEYNVSQIIDFTFLSEVLFESAKVATLAVFIQNSDCRHESLLHITVRRTKTVKEKLYFELDRYDFHRVIFRDATESNLIWKANLLGGGRLQHLLRRIESVATLKDYFKIKKQNYGWLISEGFEIGKEKEIEQLIELKSKNILSQEEKDSLINLEKKYKTANYLTNMNYLPTEAFTEKGIDTSKIGALKSVYFRRNKKKSEQVFKKPHLIIKEGEINKSIPIEFSNKDFSFMRQIIGVHAPESQVNELKIIEKRIKNNRIYIFYIAGFSGRYIVNRSTAVLKTDIESLPFPKDENELALSEFEQILVDDVLDFMLDFRRKGESSVAEKIVTDYQLDQFAYVYCRALNSVYKKFKPFQPLKTDSFICFPFYYKDKPDIPLEDADGTEDALYELIQNNVTSSARIIRILRIYGKNVIYLIKPKQARYWLRSVAIRDADETFADLIAQGY